MIVETLSTSLVRHKWHGSTSPALRAYTVERNARPVREWHAAWLAERPQEATLEEMRRRLIDRAADIRANPPPPERIRNPSRAAISPVSKGSRAGVRAATLPAFPLHAPPR